MSTLCGTGPVPIATHVALARLNQALREHPVHVDLLIEAIPRLEAKDSSGIEGIVTTGSAMFQAAASRYAQPDPATKEATAYAVALKSGTASMASFPLSWRTAKSIASTLHGQDMDLRRTTAPLKDQNTGATVYTPPLRQDALQHLISDWEKFGHTDSSLDAVTKAGLMHYQFVAIHPFADGNGRTARIMHLLWLQHLGLLDYPVLYLSRFILARRPEYYAALQATHSCGNASKILQFFSEVTEAAALWTLSRLHAVVRLHAETCKALLRHVPPRAVTPISLVLFARPYCRISDIVRTGVAKAPTAAKYMQKLTAAGILQEYRLGPEKIYAFSALEAALAC